MSVMECHHTDLAVAPGRPAIVRTMPDVIADLHRRRDEAAAAGRHDEAERIRRNLAVLLGEKTHG